MFEVTSAWKFAFRDRYAHKLRKTRRPQAHLLRMFVYSIVRFSIIRDHRQTTGFMVDLPPAFIGGISTYLKVTSAWESASSDAHISTEPQDL